MLGGKRKKNGLGTETIFTNEEEKINHSFEIENILGQSPWKILVNKFWTRLSRGLEIDTGNTKSFGEGLTRSAAGLIDIDINRKDQDA